MKPSQYAATQRAIAYESKLRAQRDLRWAEVKDRAKLSLSLAAGTVFALLLIAGVAFAAFGLLNNLASYIMGTLDNLMSIL